MRFAFKYLLAGVAMLGLVLAGSPGASALTIAPVKTAMDASAPVELAKHGGRGGRGGGVILRRNYGGSGGRLHSRGNYNRGIYHAGNRGRSHIDAGGPRLRRYNYNQGPAGRHRVRNYGYHSGKPYNRHGQYRHYDRHRHGHRYKHRHGHYRHYHDGYWYSWPWWLGTGIGIYYGGYYDQPYYGGTDAHVAWCLRRYRSYNPATDLYLGFDGHYHRCISPYGY